MPLFIQVSHLTTYFTFYTDSLPANFGAVGENTQPGRKVLNKSIAEIHNFKTELNNWINCNGELNQCKYLTDEQKFNHEKNYPVIGNTLKSYFDIAFEVPDFKNRYPKYFTLMNDFYNNCLNTDAFKAILPLLAFGFFKHIGLSVQRISGTSN